MDIEKLYLHLVKSIKQYCEEHGFSKAILGLSGGIDSAVTAALAVKALGKDNVVAVSMPGPFSSEGSKTDVEQLAGNLGIKLYKVDINDLYMLYIDTFKPLFEGKKADVTEENLQARIRANVLMAMSNKFGYLVLVTSNKSEALMGYGTLYGDLAGGLCPIGDVYKTDVYKIAEFINQEQNIIPIATIKKAPSAELRVEQKDTDDLPEYDILDKMLKDFEQGKEITDKKVAERIKKSEFKRKQAPPIVKVR